MAAASRSLLTRVAVLFANHGLAGDAHRTERLRLCSDHAGRPLHTSAQLTTTEAETLIARLAALPADVDLRHAAGRLTRTEETRARQEASR